MAYRTYKRFRVDVITVIPLCFASFQVDASGFNGELKELAPKLEIPSYSKDQNPKLCSRLLNDLRNWKNVKVIEPVAQADTLDSPGIASHLAGCDADALLTSYSIEPRVWRENNLDALTPKEREEYGTPYVMTKGFRLYQANIDNDPRGSPELVLYGSSMTIRGSEDKSSNLSYFHVLNTAKCQVTNSAQVPDVDRNPKSFVGLLQRGNRTYVFDGMYFKNESLFGVGIQEWTYSNKTKIHFFAHACNFVAKDN